MLAFWGPLGCLWGALGVSCWPSGVPWGALGVSWAPLGASRWSFGVPLASFGVRWVSLGGPLVPQGGLLGGSWVAFWLPWCGLVRFLVALGVSRGFLWRFRGLARNPAAKKEQSKRKRDTPTRTQHPLQNRASRSMTHRLREALDFSQGRTVCLEALAVYPWGVVWRGELVGVHLPPGPWRIFGLPFSPLFFAVFFGVMFDHVFDGF